jgi:hypothetical protein
MCIRRSLLYDCAADGADELSGSLIGNFLRHSRRMQRLCDFARLREALGLVKEIGNFFAFVWPQETQLLAFDSAVASQNLGFQNFRAFADNSVESEI